MKTNRERYALLIKAGLLIGAAALGVVFRGPLLRAAAGLAYTAAVMQLPAGELPEDSEPEEASVPTQSAAGLPEASEPAAASQEPETPASSQEPSGGEVRETALGLKEGDVETDGVTLSNKTSVRVDIAAALAETPEIDLVKNGRPQVLIVHTHGSEAYLEEELSVYGEDQRWNSTDPDRGVIAVGEVIAEKLNAAGISTIHDTTLHDTPQFTGAYERAGETIEKWLKKYSSIEMVIDVHRDSVTYSDGTKIKPTVEIGGKKAAQVMMIVGCAGDGALPFPDWKNNLPMAFRLQQRMNREFPGLARPIYFIDRRYNMHYTKNSLLLEIGTETNTLDEALYSAQLTADALLSVLEEL